MTSSGGVCDDELKLTPVLERVLGSGYVVKPGVAPSTLVLSVGDEIAFALCPSKVVSSHTALTHLLSAQLVGPAIMESNIMRVDPDTNDTQWMYSEEAPLALKSPAWYIARFYQVRYPGVYKLQAKLHYATSRVKDPEWRGIDVNRRSPPDHNETIAGTDGFKIEATGDPVPRATRLCNSNDLRYMGPEYGGWVMDYILASTPGPQAQYAPGCVQERFQCKPKMPQCWQIRWEFWDCLLEGANAIIDRACPKKSIRVALIGDSHVRKIFERRNQSPRNQVTYAAAKTGFGPGEVAGHKHNPPPVMGVCLGAHWVHWPHPKMVSLPVFRKAFTRAITGLKGVYSKNPEKVMYLGAPAFKVGTEDWSWINSAHANWKYAKQVRNMYNIWTLDRVGNQMSQDAGFTVLDYWNFTRPVASDKRDGTHQPFNAPIMYSFLNTVATDDDAKPQCV